MCAQAVNILEIFAGLAEFCGSKNFSACHCDNSGSVAVIFHAFSQIAQSIKRNIQTTRADELSVGFKGRADRNYQFI